jgi:hypothetical protein
MGLERDSWLTREGTYLQAALLVFVVQGSGFRRLWYGICDSTRGLGPHLLMTPLMPDNGVI